MRTRPDPGVGMKEQLIQVNKRLTGTEMALRAAEAQLASATVALAGVRACLAEIAPLCRPQSRVHFHLGTEADHAAD